jgi:hypothetical protein
MMTTHNKGYIKGKTKSRLFKNTVRSHLAIACFLATLLFLSACGGSGGTTDSGTDSSTDSGTDSGTDVATASSLSYAIVDTNQTLCYDTSTGDTVTCSGTGQDADYAGYQPDYTVSEDGTTVTDNVTGLVWQQSSDHVDSTDDTAGSDGVLNYDDKMFQADAITYCEDLVLGGREDWRLPSLKETYSLILFSGKDASNYSGTNTSTLTPFLAEEFDWAFGDLDTDENEDRIIDGQYASTDVVVSHLMGNQNDSVFGVNFVDGRIKGYPLNTKEYYVRCVAGNTEYGINDFVDNGDATITDNATGLMWQQDDSASTDWDNALTVCESADTAGYDDWRLPNVKELQSLVDYTVSPDTDGQPAIDNIFNSTSMTNEGNETDWSYYWSSTTHVDNNDDGTNATYVSFGRALGYWNEEVVDVHGAGAQRSNDKYDHASEAGATLETNEYGSFYVKGPQGDILRLDNQVRCVRDVEASPGYTLFAPMGDTTTYLINEAYETVYTWASNYNPALSVYLLDDGSLVRTGNLEAPDMFLATVGTATEGSEAGGSGGLIEIYELGNNGSDGPDWTKVLKVDDAVDSPEDFADNFAEGVTVPDIEGYLSHHDVEVLPNGNILALVWEAKTADAALALGRDRVKEADDYLWADAVYEVCRDNDDCTDGEIVWRWSVWDHVTTGNDSDKVNLNYYETPGSDWTHANAVDYNESTGEILISARNFNEYWVIDHDDSGSGIQRRFGNPAAYGGVGDQELFVQHDARWIEEGRPGAGNITVFNNGAGRSDGDYSSVDEFCDLDLDADGCTQGVMVDSYSEGVDGSFYAANISGAERLPDGNTLICEGTEGHLFEIDEDGETVWEYNKDNEEGIGVIFRANRYYESDFSDLVSSLFD